MDQSLKITLLHLCTITPLVTLLVFSSKVTWCIAVMSEGPKKAKSKFSATRRLLLKELCRDLHHKIDIVDEARYDLNIKVTRNEAEILSLTQKIYELKGKMKRPNLRRVKKSADAMLGSFTDTRVMKADFKANLKTVKKEEEKKEEVTDWRKNVEAMSGMEGRKKLFDAGQ
ncbi:troponin I4a isoform X5 [Cyprinus carpio]|uniref:Troponin I4a isoform X5 n=1 Tax=Cyprinus carpio TaxID=7962 RepID=A0A9Q9W8A7_CYPCA|nr:troponin I4a isoform X5 [Cyprinus carpio]